MTTNAPNVAGDIAAFVNTIYEDSLLIARDNNLMSALVTGFSDRSGTATRSLQTYGTATLVQVNDYDDLNSQQFTPSVLSTLAPVEFAAQFLLTDLRLETDPFQVRNDAAMELGLATAQSIELNLLNTFSSLTGGTVGAAGTVITWGHFFAMLSRLRGQNAPLPYAFVCHPYQWHVLGKAVAPGATVTNSPAIQDAMLRSFYVGSVSGVDIYTSANIAIDGSDDAKCAMFSRPAIALDVRRAPRMEVQRDASRRAWELNMTTVYKAGVWRKTFGVQATFDAATPAS